MSTSKAMNIKNQIAFFTLFASFALIRQ